MEKKARKQVEEKISTVIVETLKLQGFLSNSGFLKNVKKHSKAIVKKLFKEIKEKENASLKVAPKPKKAAVKSTAKPQQKSKLARKKAVVAVKK